MLTESVSPISAVGLCVILALFAGMIAKIPGMKYRLWWRGAVSVAVEPRHFHPIPRAQSAIVDHILWRLDIIDAKVDRLVDRAA